MLYNFLYIDPGTGSMLFSLAIGVATAGVFAFRALAVKIRFILSGGKAEKLQAGKIPYLIFSDHKDTLKFKKQIIHTIFCMNLIKKL